MSERSKYLTIVLREPTQEESSAFISHPKMSAASWSHAIDVRGSKDAEIAELRAKYEAVVFKYDAAVEKSIALMQERDEARQCVRRLGLALTELVTWTCDSDCKGDRLEDVWADEFKKAREALAATPAGLI